MLRRSNCAILTLFTDATKVMGTNYVSLQQAASYKVPEDNCFFAKLLVMCGHATCSSLEFAAHLTPG